MTFASKPLLPAKGATFTRRSLVAAAATWPLTSWSNRPLAPVDKAQPAINSVVDFDETTWAGLLKTGPRPAAYVFTTSYCSTCPDAFDKLQAYVAGTGKPVEVSAVIMDLQGARAVAHARHFAGATRLYAFDGFEPAIRQSVDPKWPNVTPYIVLIGRNGSVQRSIGPPDAATLKKWLP